MGALAGPKQKKSFTCRGMAAAAAGEEILPVALAALVEPGLEALAAAAAAGASTDHPLALVALVGREL